MHLYLSLSLPCGLFKSHPHTPTVTCTALACVDAVACGFDVPSIHIQKKYSHIFWLSNVWFITNFHDIQPVRHKYIMKNHHDALYPFASLMVLSPTSPAFHNGPPLGLRPFSEESVELFARAGEIKGQAMAKAVLAYQAHSTLGSKC